MLTNYSDTIVQSLMRPIRQRDLHFERQGFDDWNGKGNVVDEGEPYSDE